MRGWGHDLGGGRSEGRFMRGSGSVAGRPAGPPSRVPTGGAASSMAAVASVPPGACARIAGKAAGGEAACTMADGAFATPAEGALSSASVYKS